MKDEKTKIQGTLSPHVQLSGVLSMQTNSTPTYSGEYEVTPKPYEQTVLNTSGYRMEKDVTVFEIPYFETSNQSGYTVYIGGQD